MKKLTIAAVLALSIALTGCTAEKRSKAFISERERTSATPPSATAS